MSSVCLLQSQRLEWVHGLEHEESNHAGILLSMNRSAGGMWDQRDEAVAVTGHFSMVHQSFLEDSRFWYFMAVIILALSAAVVRTEVTSKADDSSAEAQRKSNGPQGGKDKPDAASSGATGSISSASSHRSSSGDPPRREGSESGDAHGERDVDRQVGKQIMLLLYCVVALNLAMIFWGIAQEHIATSKYEEESVPSMTFLVFCNRVATMVFALVILKLRGGDTYFPGFLWSAGPACSNSIASWCQYESLKYAPFTFTLMAKSCKLLPVLVIGSLRGKRHTLLDYTEAFVIVAALVVFSMSLYGAPTDSVSLLGALLVGLCILFDSLTPHLQDSIFVNYSNVDAVQATFAMSVMATCGLLFCLVVTNDLVQWVVFLQAHPIALLHLGVLSLSSCLSQYLISFTIKNFGPTVFTMIIVTRQLLAAVFSNILFEHSSSTLMWVAILTIAGTVTIRSVRYIYVPETLRRGSRGSIVELVEGKVSSIGPLLVCALVIHVVYVLYSLVEEFLTLRYFGGLPEDGGELFQYPAFNVAVNHGCGTLLAMLALQVRGVPAFGPHFKMTLIPLGSDYASTLLQHVSAYMIDYPTLVVMKGFKVMPVMLLGLVLRNRRYTTLDYFEGVLICVLVGIFVWDFQLSEGESFGGQSSLGILLMLLCVVSMSLTSCLEDFAYQMVNMDAAQMLFGLELMSTAVAVGYLAMTSQLLSPLQFLMKYPESLLYVMIEAIASAVGAYACTLTVRLYGPAVLTLLMTSRQCVSLVLSVLVFSHSIDTAQTALLVVVILVLLASSLRRVANQINQSAAEALPGLRDELGKGYTGSTMTFQGSDKGSAFTPAARLLIREGNRSSGD
jgi:adenosine 3'-phospho 5'-phosphosulfate transporter B2